MILSALTLLSVMVTTSQEPHCCGSTSRPSVTTSFTSETLHLSVCSFFNKVSGKIARHLNYIKISTVLQLKKKNQFSHVTSRSKMSERNVITYLGDRQRWGLVLIFSCANFTSTLSNFSFLPEGMLHYLAIIYYSQYIIELIKASIIIFIMLISFSFWKRIVSDVGLIYLLYWLEYFQDCGWI